MLIRAFSRWTPWSRLLPIDIQGADGVRNSIEDRDLKEAYSEAIEQYGRSSLAYWKDRLFAKSVHQGSVSKKFKVEIGTGVSPLKRTVSAMGFIYPPVIGLPAELDDGFKKEGEKSPFLQNDDTDSDKSKGSHKRMKLNSGRAGTPVFANASTSTMSASVAETTPPSGCDATLLIE